MSNFIRNAWGGFDPAPQKDVPKAKVAVAERPDPAQTAALAALLGLDRPEPESPPMPEPPSLPPEPARMEPVIMPTPVVVNVGGAPRVRVSLAESVKTAPSSGGKICMLTGAPLGKCPQGPSGCVPGDAAGWSGKADF